MADVTLTPQTVTREGIQQSFTALNAVDVYFVSITDRTILHFINDGASPATVTLVTPGNVSGLTIEDPTVVVPATSHAMASPLPRGVFADGSGQLQFTQDQATGVTVAVVQTP